VKDFDFLRSKKRNRNPPATHHVGWVKDFDFLRSKKRNRNPPYKRTNEIIEHIWIFGFTEEEIMKHQMYRTWRIIF